MTDAPCFDPTCSCCGAWEGLDDARRDALDRLRNERETNWVPRYRVVIDFLSPKGCSIFDRRTGEYLKWNESSGDLREYVSELGTTSIEVDPTGPGAGICSALEELPNLEVVRRA